MSLQDVYEDYVCQKSLLKNLESRSGKAGGDDFMKNVASFPGLSRLPENAKQRRLGISSTIERMNERLDDLYLVGLVSAFENFVFLKLRKAAPLAADTLDRNYGANDPVGSYRTGLAKTLEDFSRLGDLHPLFDKGGLSPDQRSELRELIQLRSFIAHGRRQDWNNAKDLQNLPGGV